MPKYFAAGFIGITLRQGNTLHRGKKYASLTYLVLYY